VTRNALRDARAPYGPRAGALALRRMDPTPGSARRPRLAVVRPTPRVDREALGRAVEACVAARPDGLPPSELLPALSARLGIAADEIGERDLDVALGLLVVGGRIDEAAGRLVATAQDARATG